MHTFFYRSRERGWNEKSTELRKSPELQKWVQRPWQRRGRSWRRSWGLQGFRYARKITWRTVKGQENNTGLYETRRIKKENQELHHTNALDQVYRLFCCILYSAVRLCNWNISALRCHIWNSPWGATDRGHGAGAGRSVCTTGTRSAGVVACCQVEIHCSTTLIRTVYFCKWCTYHLIGTLREVWPEGDVFGSADVEPDEELELLKQVLHANLPSECFHIQTFFFNFPSNCLPFKPC